VFILAPSQSGLTGPVLVQSTLLPAGRGGKTVMIDPAVRPLRRDGIQDFFHALSGSGDQMRLNPGISGNAKGLATALASTASDPARPMPLRETERPAGCRR